MKAVAVIKPGLLVAVLATPLVVIGQTGQTQPTAGTEPWSEIIKGVIALAGAVLGLVLALSQIRKTSLESRKLELEILKMGEIIPTSSAQETVRASAEPMMRPQVLPETVRPLAEPMRRPQLLVVSYFRLRTIIGLIGLALPFVLAFGKILLQGPGLESSLSGYYYTDMRDVFVGSLCALGVFFMIYRGYDRRDAIAGYLACVFAIGAAFFPTTPYMNATSRDELLGMLHATFTVLLFLTFAYFSLALFTKTAFEKMPTRPRLQRNIVYRVCGYTILASIFFIFVVTQPEVQTVVGELKPVFWLESLAMVAFGVSWLTKGEAILKD